MPQGPSDTAEFHIFARTLLVTVLVLAVLAKMRDWESFRGVLTFLAPSFLRRWTHAVASFIVGSEFALVAILAIGGDPKVGLATVAGFLGLASGMLLVLKRLGYKGGCACFGHDHSNTHIGVRDFIRNGLLVSVAVGSLVLGWVPDGPAVPLWALPAGQLLASVAATIGVLLAWSLVAAVLAILYPSEDSLARDRGSP